MKRPLIMTFFALAAVMVLAATASCGRGLRSPGPDTFRSEPTISLFINETGEKKSIKLEEYLAGVVAAEMDTNWPVNALAAQAILARTFTMENIKAGRVKKIHGTDASTSIEEFQAYDPGRINDNVRKAVDMTRGEVVLYRGNYVKGWFSACDGGISASAEEGLSYTRSPTPYIRAGVKDGCLSVTTPENRSWTATIPLEQVRQAVQKTGGQNPGNISSAGIADRGPSGRAQKIRIGSAVVGGPALRLALGSEKMRSTLLSGVSVKGGNLELTGRGFGHGVGMCQWGAKKLAGEGKSPEDIIRFYFQGINITKMWE